MKFIAFCGISSLVCYLHHRYQPGYAQDGLDSGQEESSDPIEKLLSEILSSGNWKKQILVKPG